MVSSRFWEKVNKTSTCWVWSGATQKGYGAYWNGIKVVRAHRYIFEETYGALPAHIQVCHTCDNPPCVRPDHLFSGTNKENALDCAAKERYLPNRRPRGEQCHTKIKTKDVIEIRKLHMNKIPKKELASMYGISRRMISYIVNNQWWKSVVL